MPLRIPLTFFVLFLVQWPVVPVGPVAPAAAQEPVHRRTAMETADSAAIAGLARSLVAGAATDSARAAALYGWIARNIAYDIAGYRAGRIGGETAETVYRRRTAVCGGYVALYERMARETGLVVEPVAGYAKGFDYEHGRSTRRVNHAWLAVQVDDSWRLVDPTWGAGVVRAGRFEPRFDWYYFMVSPDELLLSHFPEKPEWQLVARPMRRREFERLPAVPRAVFEVGFTPADVRASALASAVRDFPAVGTGTGGRVVRAPIAGTVRRAATLDFEVIWPGAADVAVVSGGVWTHLERAGDRFHGRAPAADPTVWVIGRTGPDPLSYRTLLHYRVE